MSIQKGNGPGATNDRPAKIHTKYATDFMGACARHASATANFRANPCAGMGKVGKGAAKGCATVLSGASNTIDNAGNLPDSEVFSRPEFKDGPKFRCIYGFGRDGLVRKAGRMALSMFETSRPPVARSNAASGLQSHNGAETMTNVISLPARKASHTATTTAITTAPALGNIERQQAIENALSMALFHIRHGDIHSATGRAIRAASLLKQACAEFAVEGSAA